MGEEFLEDLGAGAGGHGLLDVVARGGGVEAVAPEDLDVGGLGEEVGLVGDDDAEAPGAVFEGGEGAGAGGVAGELGEVGEEEARGGV